MKFKSVIPVLFLLPFVASAQTTIKSCEDVKADIAKKLDAKGIVGYTLTIVDKGKDSDGKIVGNCGGGTKSIVYQRPAAAPAPAPQPKPADTKKSK